MVHVGWVNPMMILWGLCKYFDGPCLLGLYHHDHRGITMIVKVGEGKGAGLKSLDQLDPVIGRENP